MHLKNTNLGMLLLMTLRVNHKVDERPPSLLYQLGESSELPPETSRELDSQQVISGLKLRP